MSLSAYQKENDGMINSFLGRTFFEAWKHPEDDRLLNFQSLELILNYKCDLGCKYCYVHRFGDELYPPEIQDSQTILSNAELVLDWLARNGYHPSKIELFSGEPLIQPLAFQVLDRVLDRIRGSQTRIVIPTNFTFLLNDALTKRVEAHLQLSKDQGNPIFLSASIDGKYCETNRPFLDGRPDPRDDAYYEKAFAFVKKWNLGFHPMLYSERIEYWKRNFLWFQEMFKKYKLPWYHLYLLEVRNAEWSVPQILEYGRFVEFLIKWCYDKCGRNFSRYREFLFRHRGFNMLANPLSTVGRGIGCSIQATFAVRLGDLSIVPCHRTSYKPFILGKMRVEGGRITGIEALNPELWIALVSVDGNCLPYCEQCMIKSLCPKGCFGSQLEINGDLFEPIPTVCMLMHEKIRAMVKTYEELGIYSSILASVNEDKRQALEQVRAMMRR